MPFRRGGGVTERDFSQRKLDVSSAMETASPTAASEAGAVHAGCGTWGCLAVGLLHPSRGLLASGSFALLGVQLVGVAVILTFAFSSALVVAYALREMELLRVSPEEEAKGLDHRFGIAANATLYDKAIRMREASAVLEANGHTVSELIEALQAIKHHIILPFNPHASDLMLEGQVDDVRTCVWIEEEDCDALAVRERLCPCLKRVLKCGPRGIVRFHTETERPVALVHTRGLCSRVEGYLVVRRCA